MQIAAQAVVAEPPGPRGVTTSTRLRCTNDDARHSDILLRSSAALSGDLNPRLRKVASSEAPMQSHPAGVHAKRTRRYPFMSLRVLYAGASAGPRRQVEQQGW